MIKTKDLTGFLTQINTGNNALSDIEVEYMTEIVTRLEELDRLKEIIKSGNKEV